MAYRDERNTIAQMRLDEAIALIDGAVTLANSAGGCDDMTISMLRALAGRASWLADCQEKLNGTAGKAKRAA